MLLVFLLFLRSDLTISLFDLYHTKYLVNEGDHDCLYRSVRTVNNFGQHLVPYCIRTSDLRKINELPCFGTNYTFATLSHLNVTVNDLFNWNAPFDLISDYTHFLINGNYAEEIFCNCSHVSYFGDRCQYFFALNLSSFDDIVEQVFVLKTIEDPRKRTFDVRQLNEKDLTCYEMLNCTKYIDLCFDWRQICDGLRDCIDGRDEEHCLEMEFSECDSRSEYRCRNGFCVPRDFLFDLTMDCMDFSDEQIFHDTSQSCFNQSSIDCEDHICGLATFSCGDGTCFQSYKGQENQHGNVYKECHSQRNTLYLKQIFRYENKTNLSDQCWQHMWCLLGLSCLYEHADTKSRCHEGAYFAGDFCKRNRQTHSACPDKFFFPPTQFIFPGVQLLYTNQVYTNQNRAVFTEPIAICFNTSIYTSQLLSSISDLKDKLEVFHGYDCGKLINFSLWQLIDPGLGISHASILVTGVHSIFSPILNIHRNISKSLYRCPSSLFLSFYRHNDGYEDCFPNKNDEYKSNSCENKRDITDYFECREGPLRVCIPRRLLRDTHEDCGDGLDEYFPIGCTNEFDCRYLRYFDFKLKLLIFYGDLCNGYKNIEQSFDSNETDETNCDQWPCKARGIRCNSIWNRPNGCDELDCSETIPGFITHRVANCSANEHYCFQLNRPNISCISVSKANNGIFDCLFKSDERFIFNILKLNYLPHHEELPSLCYNDSNESAFITNICDGTVNCPFGEDESICPWLQTSSCPEFSCRNGTCLAQLNRCNGEIDCLEAEDEWACDIINTVFLMSLKKPFTIDDFSLSKQQVRNLLSVEMNTTAIFLCHRGILVYDRFLGYQCFCPPSYYGKLCEYQSERLSISFRMEMTTRGNTQIIYQLVFYLLDEHNHLLNIETIIYAPIIHSSLKHLLILIYPRINRSYFSFNNLSVWIDGYILTTKTVDYSRSWLFPIQFPFLPVNRLAVRLLDDPIDTNGTICAQLDCKHGTCKRFSNSNRHFCRCYSHWTSSTCNQTVEMPICDNPSKSVVVNGHGLCICPLGRSGRQCHVTHNNCDDLHCENDGTCVTLDIRVKERICICREHYFGDRCQYEDVYFLLEIPSILGSIRVLIIHFVHSSPSVPGVFLHHDIRIYNNIQSNQPFKIYYQNEQIVTIVFAQIFTKSDSYYGSYYLINFLNINQMTYLSRIDMNTRCPYISERLNSSLMNFEWLKRVKFYHIYFTNVKCYHDEIFMCFVDEEQMSECLNFNHEMTNCTDRNYCSNNGRCFQEKRSGRSNFACLCPDCISGAFCQIQMMQFFLTLDSMLGDAILTNTSWNQQFLLIHLFTGFVVIMFCVGILSNILSLITFTNKKIREHGCGNYLLILSIVSQLTIILFTTRFIYLLLTQMIIITNQRLLTIVCRLFDFILDFFLSLCDGLTICIACERTFNTLKGTNFRKKTSVRVVKFVVPILCVFLILTSIHQCFNRILISDPYINGRFWCVIQFDQVWIKNYTIGITIFNTIIPFLINFLSAVILLLLITRTKKNVNKKKNYLTILNEQFREHKDLLIGPLVIIICKIPHISVRFIIKCIEYPWQLYLTIFSYCLSLLPLIATFAMFVLPSTSYMEVFHKKWSKIRHRR